MLIAPNHCFHANFGGPNFQAFHDFIPENILGIMAFLDMNCKYEVKKLGGKIPIYHLEFLSIWNSSRVGCRFDYARSAGGMGLATNF